MKTKPFLSALLLFAVSTFAVADVISEGPLPTLAESDGRTYQMVWNAGGLGNDCFYFVKLEESSNGSDFQPVGPWFQARCHAPEGQPNTDATLRTHVELQDRRGELPTVIRPPWEAHRYIINRYNGVIELRTQGNTGDAAWPDGFADYSPLAQVFVLLRDGMSTTGDGTRFARVAESDKPPGLGD